MHLLPRVRRITSEKNGTITVIEWLWYWTVNVGAWEESGPYLRAMWKDSLRRLGENFSAERVLILGLGGGASIRDIEKRFPNAEITAIEWDPQMIQIARELHAFKKEPVIILGDIGSAVPALKEQFDLIFIDTFFGNEPDSKLFLPYFLESLSRILSDTGCIVLNASRTVDLVSIFAQSFDFKEKWKFRNNTLARYSRKK